MDKDPAAGLFIYFYSGSSSIKVRFKSYTAKIIFFSLTGIAKNYTGEYKLKADKSGEDGIVLTEVYNGLENRNEFVFNKEIEKVFSIAKGKEF